MDPSLFYTRRNLPQAKVIAALTSHEAEAQRNKDNQRVALLYLSRGYPPAADARQGRPKEQEEPIYQALWADTIDFNEMLISPVMIHDHMPDTVLMALNKVPYAPLLFPFSSGHHREIRLDSLILLDVMICFRHALL